MNILVGMSDLPAGIFMFCVLLITYLYSRIGDRKAQIYQTTLVTYITFIYLASALICSACFSETEFFLASDPTRYITMVRSSKSYDLLFDEITNAYVLLKDNNGLYNSLLRLLGIICNENGYTASSLLITLPQTLFGILSIQTVFRIFINHFTYKRALHYSFLFGICSLTLLYSCIIVRDIIIVFFFTVCLEVILKPFSMKGVVIIILMMALCIGIRLYSGCFISLFLVYYLLFGCKSTISKVIAYAFAIVAAVSIGGSVIVTELVEKTNEEISGYSEWQGDIASSEEGFSSKLRNLPNGINYLALSLYSQMNPFPPYSTFKDTDLKFNKMYMATLMMVPAIWWFFISYSLLWFLFFNRGYRFLGKQYFFLFCIAWLLIIVSSAMHVDIRRLLPVYPIIFYLSMICSNFIFSRKHVKIVRRNLGVGYIILNIIYIVIK